MDKKDIKFEILKRRINVKSIVIVLLIVVVIGLVVVNRVSHAAYTSSLSVPLVNGKINYKHPDFKMVSMHVQDGAGSSTYNETNTMPSGQEYVINSSKSYCNKGNTSEKDTGVVLKTVNGNHVMNNLTKNDRCFLYFDKVNNVASILAKYTKDNNLNSADDDYGPSYVFAIENPNNWVRLGNTYFRIIRFNGNGSMRLIYSGSGSAQTNGTGTQIGVNCFNEYYNDNAYVGLQYTEGEVHGSDQNSTILGEINSTNATTLYGWYNNNIKTNYESIIDSSVGFCNDRDNYTNQSGTIAGGGIGKIETYYGAYLRCYMTTIPPTLKCKNSEDLLKLPVGLITADEYFLAGGSLESSSVWDSTFWLSTGQNYWTMSPFYAVGAFVFQVSSSGYLHGGDGEGVSDVYGVRPVINLKSTTAFENNGADGTSTKPYVVQAP